MKSCFFIIIISSFAIFYGCSKDDVEPTHTEFKIVDDIGEEVKLGLPPRRLVSMAPNITEALYAIGADSLLVGVTSFCNYPPQAKEKTKIGDYISPDYETITSLKPDLILLNVESKSNPTYQALENLGLPIYVVNIDDYDGVMKMIENLGKITLTNSRARNLIDSLNLVRDNYRKQIPSDSIPGAFVIISTNPLMTASGKTFINDVIKMSGLYNIYSKEEMEYPTISYEDVLNKDPDYIILPTDTTNNSSIETSLNEIRDGLSTTKAVKQNNIIIIDADVMFRPGPRVLNGVDLIKKRM